MLSSTWRLISTQWILKKIDKETKNVCVPLPRSQFCSLTSISFRNFNWKQMLWRPDWNTHHMNILQWLSLNLSSLLSSQLLSCLSCLPYILSPSRVVLATIYTSAACNGLEQISADTSRVYHFHRLKQILRIEADATISEQWHTEDTVDVHQCCAKNHHYLPRQAAMDRESWKCQLGTDNSRLDQIRFSLGLKRSTVTIFWCNRAR